MKKFALAAAALVVSSSVAFAEVKIVPESSSTLIKSTQTPGPVIGGGVGAPVGGGVVGGGVVGGGAVGGGIFAGLGIAGITLPALVFVGVTGIAVAGASGSH